jgi:hypothetical protein
VKPVQLTLIIDNPNSLVRILLKYMKNCYFLFSWRLENIKAIVMPIEKYIMPTAKHIINIFNFGSSGPSQFPKKRTTAIIISTMPDNTKRKLHRL